MWRGVELSIDPDMTCHTIIHYGLCALFVVFPVTAQPINCLTLASSLWWLHQLLICLGDHHMWRGLRMSVNGSNAYRTMVPDGLYALFVLFPLMTQC